MTRKSRCLKRICRRPDDNFFQVASGTTASINSGEPVGFALGQQYAATLATNKPVVGTDYLAGVSASASTETASAAGSVYVYNPFDGKVVFLIAPKVPATWNTQSAYNALVGARVLLDKTNDVYTILATDGSTNGCVIEDLDILKYPGLVAFSFRQGCNYLA